MKKKQWLSLLLVGAALTASLAEEAKDKEKPKDIPKPDLAPIEISVPNGLKAGIGSQVKVLVDNLTKSSDIKGKVAVELVVISVQTGERVSYRTEVDAMKFQQKKEAVFPDVRVPAATKIVRLLAIVDPESGVEELTKDNNRRLFQVTLGDSGEAPSEEPKVQDEGASKEAPTSVEEAPGKAEEEPLKVDDAPAEAEDTQVKEEPESEVEQESAPVER